MNEGDLTSDKPGTCARDNGGKVKFSMVPLPLLAGAARVLMAGAIKYAAWNWAKGSKWSQSFDCACRHLFKWWFCREDIDPESGRHHLDHVLCNVLFLRHNTLSYQEGDDRPPASALMGQYVDFINEVFTPPPGRHRMIRRIFLDLDDVLNTLSIHVIRSLSSEIAVDYESYPRKHGFDIVGVANELLKRTRCYRTQGLQYEEDDFWCRFSAEFWATIPKSPECDWLIDQAESLVGCESVWILTKGSGAASLAGKQVWIESNLPAWMRDRMITCAHKDCCAANDSLLVDDNQDNIQAFINRGGHAIMRPRPWNDLWWIKDGAMYVETQLRVLFGRDAA